jgi:transposase
MISVRSGLRILVTTSPVDFRRGMDSLAMLVTETLRGDPFCGDFFVVRWKRSDRVKILAWDGTGLVLYSKRLETSSFIWPAIHA